MNNLANFFIFWENMVKSLVTYLKNCMVGVILKTISIKEKIVNFKNHLLTAVQTSKTLHCHKFSADFTNAVSLTKELFLHSWLTFGEKVLVDAIHYEFQENWLQELVLRSFVSSLLFLFSISWYITSLSLLLILEKFPKPSLTARSKFPSYFFHNCIKAPQ